MGAFGYHQAVKVNDRIVGFGPEGVHEENSSLYGGRASHEVVIHPDDKFDDAYNKWLDNALQGKDPRFTPDNYWSNNWPPWEGESCYTFCDTAIKEADKNPCP